NGRFPVRKDGIDWKDYVPGDRSDLIPNAIVPFDKLPQLWNPRSGFVFNSNNTPFRATAPEDDLKPSDYPAWMGIQTNMNNRAFPVLEPFGADKAITADAFHKYKFDVRYSTRSQMAGIINELCHPVHDAKACDLLTHWNLSADIHSRGAALAILTVVPVVR